VGLGPVGAGVTVGHTAGRGAGPGLVGAGRCPGGVAGAKAAPHVGVADRRRLRSGLPGADLFDALVAVHRAGTRPDVALPPRPGRHTGAAGRGRFLRAEPAGRARVAAVAGRVC
jgi:hypothetical protein